MNLTIDIGNTNIKCGVFDGDKLVYSLRLASSASKTSDEYGLTMRDLLESNGISVKDIDGVIMSSVNPNLNYTFEHMSQYYFGTRPLVVGGGIKSGIRIRYDNPKEVGADRIVNSVAAYYTYGGPVIVIDCGTATTFNYINAQGEFLGGAISFGLKTSMDALTSATAKLPKIELVAPAEVLGRNTITNMQSGIIYGFIGMVEYLVRRLKEEVGDAKVVATGGLSEIVARDSSAIDVVDRTLTLRGLNIIYNLNRKDRQKENA